MTTSIDKCDICMAPIESNEVRYGHGDGTGNKFVHYGCYWREQAEIEKKRADAAEADAKRYRWIRVNPTWIGYDSDYREDFIDEHVDEAIRND